MEGSADSPPDGASRWDDRYRGMAQVGEPATFLDELEPLLPAVAAGGSSMVDLAGGAGANARWFAARGYAVTVVDISTEALRHARAWADLDGVAVECVHRDLERDGLPAGRAWDVALMHLYFDPGVLRGLPAVVVPGGLVVVAQPTRTNLARHARPGARFLLEPGALAALVATTPELEVITLDEGWRASGRHEARLVARRR